MAYLRHSIYDEQIKKENALYHYGTKGMKWDSSKRVHKDSDYDANGNLVNNNSGWKPIGSQTSVKYDRNGERLSDYGTHDTGYAATKIHDRLVSQNDKTANTNKPESQILKENKEAQMAKQREANARQAAQAKAQADAVNAAKERDKNMSWQDKLLSAAKKFPSNLREKYSGKLLSLRGKLERGAQRVASELGNAISTKANNLGNSIRDKGLIGTAKSYGSNLKKRGKNAVKTLLYGKNGK